MSSIDNVLSDTPAVSTMTHQQERVLRNEISDLRSKINDLERERDRLRSQTQSGMAEVLKARDDFLKSAQPVKNFVIALRELQNALIKGDL